MSKPTVQDEELDLNLIEASWAIEDATSDSPHPAGTIPRRHETSQGISNISLLKDRISKEEPDRKVSFLVLIGSVQKRRFMAA
jgi:hypothetical protein